MARQWIDPVSGMAFDEDGSEEYIHPAAGVAFQEDQAAAEVVGPTLKHPIEHHLHNLTR